MRPSAAIFAVAALVAVVVSRADAEPQRSRQETAAESYGGSSGGVRYLNSRVASGGVAADRAATASWYRKQKLLLATSSTTTLPPPPARHPFTSSRTSSKHPGAPARLEDSPPEKKPYKKYGKPQEHRRRHHHGEYVAHVHGLQALTAGSSEYKAIQQGSYFDNKTANRRPYQPPAKPDTVKDKLFDWGSTTRADTRPRYWRTTTTTGGPQAWAAREGYVYGTTTPRPDNAEQLRRNAEYAAYLQRVSGTSSTVPPVQGGGSGGSSAGYYRGRRPSASTRVHSSEQGLSYASGSYFAHRASSGNRRAQGVTTTTRRPHRVRSTTTRPITTTTIPTTTTTTTTTVRPTRDDIYNTNYFDEDYDESVHPLERLFSG